MNIKDTIIKKIILNHNKWLLLYLLWTCGVVLLYASFLYDKEERNELLIYNSIFIVLIFTFCLGFSGWIRKLVLILFSFLALPPTIIETGWFTIDRSTLIRNQFYVIFATNPAEASGLLSMISIWQWVLLFSYLCIWIIFFLLAIKECGEDTNYSKSIVAGLLTVSLIFIPGIRYNVPCVDFYNSYRVYRKDLKQANKFMQSRPDLRGKVYGEFPDSVVTIVVIIGESLNRSHCSLYGYCRPTNPLLEKRKDIYVYQNVQSAYFMTQEVLEQVLLLSTESNHKIQWNNPTLPELLKAAGWHTYWFEPYEGRRNTANTIPTSYTIIARLCDTFLCCDESEQFDGAYLNRLEEVLKDSAFRKKAVFLHLIGNHFPYERRYPHTYKYFTSEDICSPYLDKLSSKQKEVINAYDDAVRYNDWFVDSVLTMLGQQEQSCAMLYFSDHGEEVYDCDFYAGRSFNHITRSLYEVPCLYWQNDSFKQVHPLQININKSYCTENMIHTLLDLFAVSCTKKDTCNSLFHNYGCDP